MKLSVRGDRKHKQASTSSNIIEFSTSQATRYRMDDFVPTTRKPHSVVFLFVFAFPCYQEHKHIIVIMQYYQGKTDARNVTFGDIVLEPSTSASQTAAESNKDLLAEWGQQHPNTRDHCAD